MQDSGGKNFMVVLIHSLKGNFKIKIFSPASAGLEPMGKK